MDKRMLMMGDFSSAVISEVAFASSPTRGASEQHLPTDHLRSNLRQSKVGSAAAKIKSKMSNAPNF
jgi:hypothetical protein